MWPLDAAEVQNSAFFHIRMRGIFARNYIVLQYFYACIHYFNSSLQMCVCVLLLLLSMYCIVLICVHLHSCKCEHTYLLSLLTYPGWQDTTIRVGFGVQVGDLSYPVIYRFKFGGTLWSQSINVTDDCSCSIGAAYMVHAVCIEGHNCRDLDVL